MKILFEDTHFIILSKPQGVPSQKDQTGDKDLCTAVADYISRRDGKRTSLFVVHRLDRPVGGIIVYAKSAGAAGAFSKIISAHEIDKKYICVTDGKPPSIHGQLIHHLKKKAGQNVSVAVHANNDGAKEARLDYTCLESIAIRRDVLSLMEITLHTGRHHQIRVQMSSADMPLWGDAKYHPNARRKRNWTQIALWSYRLDFTHPFTKERVSLFDAPPNAAPWNLFEMFKDEKEGASQ